MKWYAPNGRWGLRGDYRFGDVRATDDAPSFFGRDDRSGHRVYGGVIINARVSIMNTGTNVATELKTDSAGRFLAPALPAGSAVQVPTEPTTSQRWQLPTHGESQQAPSTQKPLMHWFMPVHMAPFICLARHFPCALQ